MTEKTEGQTYKELLMELQKKVSGLTTKSEVEEVRKQVQELHDEVHKAKEPDQSGSQRLDVRSDGHLAQPSGSTPTPSASGSHRTVREILDCPTCGKAIKEAIYPSIEKEMREKHGNFKCEKGHPCWQDEEICPVEGCGSTKGTRIAKG